MVSVDTTGMKKVGDGVGLGGAHHGLSPNMSSVAAAAPVCGAGVGSRVITVKSPLWSPLPARAAEIPAMATAVVMQRRTVAMLGKLLFFDFSLHWVVVAPLRTPKHDIIEIYCRNSYPRLPTGPPLRYTVLQYLQ